MYWLSGFTELTLYYYFAGNRFKDSKLKASIVQSLREKGHNVTDNKASVTDVNGVSYFQEKISAHADSRRGGAQGSAQFWLLHWVVIMNFKTWGDLTHTLWKIVRLVSSRYLRGYFSLSLPVSPRAPQPNPILLSCPKHVSSDWVRVWKIVANHRTGSGKTVQPFTIIWNNNAIQIFNVWNKDLQQLLLKLCT